MFIEPGEKISGSSKTRQVFFSTSNSRSLSVSFFVELNKSSEQEQILTHNSAINCNNSDIPSMYCYPCDCDDDDDKMIDFW